MKTTGSIEIDRPPAEVFDFTTNHVAEWSAIVVSDEVVDEKPGGVGSTFRTVTEERGKRMEFDGTVTRHEPPHHHAIHMAGQQFDIDVEYLIEPLSDTRTRLTQTSHVHPKGFLKVVFALFGWLMKRGGCDALDKELANLKSILEAKS